MSSSTKVALVTGAARGQGRAIAQRFAREGCDVIGLDVCAPVATVKGYEPSDTADLEYTQHLVEKEGRRASMHVVDVRDFPRVEDAVHIGVDELGHLDNVVASAGIVNGSRMTWDIDEEQWQTVIDVNLTGAWHTMKVVAPILIDQDDGGSIVAINSVCGMKGMPFLAAYNAAKHGLLGLTRTLANELAEYEIRVNSVHPAGVDTPLGHDSDGAELVEQYSGTLSRMYQNSLPAELVSPEDIAALTVWLCQDEAKSVTGSQFPVDLGRLNR